MALFSLAELHDEKKVYQHACIDIVQRRVMATIDGLGIEVDPNPLFDCDFYLTRNSDIRAAGGNPLSHYLAHGWREGCDPHPLFDTDWYLAQNPDVQAAGVNPLVQQERAVRRVVHHRGGTGPGLDASAEMLRGVDLHRPPHGQGRANGVRAAGQLVPVGPGLQADDTRCIDRGWIAFGLEDHALWIGEDHDRPRL